MRDIILQLLFILVFVLIMFAFITIPSGCQGYCARLTKAIFNSESSPADVGGEAPSPAKRLLATIKKSSWVTTLAIPIIALGAVAMFNGAAKLGMSAIIFGSVNLFMALATARFALWMAVFGLIGSVSAVLMSIMIKNKALKDVVTNVQDIKESAANGGTKAKIQKDIKAVLLKQAKSTNKLVSKIRAKL